MTAGTHGIGSAAIHAVFAVGDPVYPCNTDESAAEAARFYASDAETKGQLPYSLRLMLRIIS